MRGKEEGRSEGGGVRGKEEERSEGEGRGKE